MKKLGILLLVVEHLHPIVSSAVDTWATVAVAIGTVGAVVYALFRDLFVKRRRPPRLDLRFDDAGERSGRRWDGGAFDAA